MNSDEYLVSLLNNYQINISLEKAFDGLSIALQHGKLRGTLYPFGSYCNGFGGNSSDLDCVFLTPCDDKSSSLLNSIGDAINLYKQKQQQPELRIKAYITQAKVPILKIEDLTNKVEIDLSINNINGIINSKLLYEYSILHPKIKQLGQLLKLWGKANKIIQSGFMTSYSIILMLIHFLQSEYDVPYLSDVQLTKEQLINLEFVENNPYFRVDLKVQLAKLDQTTLNQLLIEFFEYYQINGELDKKQCCISLHKGLINNYSSHSLKIIDPINTRYDPSKRFVTKSNQYQKDFEYAAKQLKLNNYSIFENNNQQNHKNNYM